MRRHFNVLFREEGLSSAYFPQGTLDMTSFNGIWVVMSLIKKILLSQLRQHVSTGIVKKKQHSKGKLWITTHHPHPFQPRWRSDIIELVPYVWTLTPFLLVRSKSRRCCALSLLHVRVPGFSMAASNQRQHTE